MNCSYATLLHNSVKIVNIILWDIEFVFFLVGFATKINDSLWFYFTIAFLENTFQDITRFVAYTFIGS